jgi:hypothetical protein
MVPCTTFAQGDACHGRYSSVADGRTTHRHRSSLSFVLATLVPAGLLAFAQLVRLRATAFDLLFHSQIDTTPDGRGLGRVAHERENLAV